MAFQEKIVSLGTTDTLLFECPVTLSGSAHGIVFSNITATPQPITFKHYCKATGITQTLAQGRAVPANSEIAWPKPINLAAGDQLIAVASALNAVTALSSIYLAASAPVSAGFSPRGEHSIIATYVINDVVSKGGSSYIAIAPNVNDAPPSSSWMLQAEMGEKGDKGADGVDGTNGTNGIDGVTQTVASLGLNNVDNTADADKPVSTAQATAIAAAKSQAISAIPASLPASDVSAWAKAATKPSYTAAEVGLGNVTNTSDADKPVSTAQQTALNLKATLTANTFTGLQTFNAGAALASGDPVGYMGIPQNIQSADYTTVLADQGKHILHPSADTTARIFTIPANTSVAYPINTAITFINQASAGVLTIAITTDTMRLAGAGTTGSRTLAANGIATAVKLTATEWIISGTNLT